MIRTLNDMYMAKVKLAGDVEIHVRARWLVKYRHVSGLRCSEVYIALLELI